MTIEFDNMARKRLDINRFPPFDASYTIKDLIVTKCDTKLAREYIATYHYTKLFPDSTRNTFIGKYGESLGGIITFGTGCGMNIFRSLIPNIPAKSVRELTRLWSPDGLPKNTESKMIMESIKQLPKEVKLIVSFADPAHNHIGTIYQATNFYYCGMSNTGKQIIDKNGQYFHPRNIGIYKLRHPEYKGLSTKDIMNIYGWKYVSGNGKYRYVLLRGTHKEKKEMYEQIKEKIQPYPKNR